LPRGLSVRRRPSYSRPFFVRPKNVLNSPNFVDDAFCVLGRIAYAVLLGSAIALRALIGLPIDPEKIRKRMALSNRAEQSQIVPERSDGDEDIEEYLNRRGLSLRIRRGDGVPDTGPERPLR
jgi:hypothetical protein